YRTAELEAIKGAILRDARHLLAQADEENVEKFAPQTLEQAKASLAEADQAIVEDRYDTDRARLLAKQAKEQASHALHLTAQIQAVNDDNREFEAVLLRAEAPVVDIANALSVTPYAQSRSARAGTDAARTVRTRRTYCRTRNDPRRPVE
ncbi:MAG: DUF4398 domain-containing protein, partial [Proteobacteria bacterium]|nr:DUF4398 domain-containing protein [Pseudomonadota bacterium]